MLLAIFLFLLSAAAIYFASEYFVNGIEWLGRRLNLGATAVGSVLAAFGTALPESAVTFIAVVFGATPAAKNVGVGAAMGGPLVLSTLAYAVVGLAVVLGHRRLHRDSYALQADNRRLARDQASFLGIFVFKVALGLVAFAIKPWLGWLFLAAYAVYVFAEIRDAHTAPNEEKLGPLKIRPHIAEPSLFWAALQSLAAMLVVAYASHVFVAQLETIGDAMGWSAQLVALILSPVATELPEIMNAVIWIRQGKERLALANISGSMMIQATIPSALGIFFTPWLFDPALILSGVITIFAIVYVWHLFHHGMVDAHKLLAASGFYALFAVGVVSWFTWA